MDLILKGSTFHPKVGVLNEGALSLSKRHDRHVY